MKKVLFTSCIFLLTNAQLFAQDLTQNYRKLILNSSNGISLFQSNSPNGIWASGMTTSDRWGIFEDATTAKERFTILAGGHVGIGTNNPRSKFHIYNGNSGGTPHTFSDITIEDSDYGMVSILTPNNKKGYFGFADSEDDYVGGMEYDHVNDRMILRVNNHANDITIHSSGNVGIGTTTPNKSLEIKGNDGIGVRLFNTEANTWDILNTNLGKLDFVRGSNKTFMRIDQIGNVGIGTENPDAKLSVKGQIHTNEVKVDLLGAVAPDYVFYKDYNLKTLQDVEKYIAQEGHLPNIPSAKAMETHGIMLKEMNLKLLEKIEELTLYTINQEKRIATLETENKTLKTQDERIMQLEKKLVLLLNKN